MANTSMRRAALILILATAALAQTPVQRQLTLEDFYRIKNIGDIDLSPDGNWAAFVVTEIDRGKDSRRAAIWRAGIPPNATLPHPITTRAKTRDSSPRWSPDGRYLAFLADRDEKNQIWLLPTEGGEAFPLTKEKSGVNGFAWAPDSKRILFTATDPEPDEGEKKDEKEKTPRPIVVTRLQHKRDGAGYLDRRRTHFYLIGVEGGESQQLTRGEWDESDPQWSPDGTRVAFSSNRTSDPDSNRNTDIWVLRIEDGSITKITTDPGRDSNPRWSPDGKWLAYVHTPTQPPVYSTPRLMLIAGDGSGAPRDLTGALDRQVTGSPVWAPDGQSIFVRLEDSGSTPLLRITTSGVAERVISDGRDAGEFKISADGTKIVALVSQPTAPSEIYVKLLNAPSLPEGLTNINGRLFSELLLNPPVKILYRSKDGTPIEGFLIKPPKFDPSVKHPMIVRIHGGPVSQYTGGFSFEQHYLASLGYVVLYVNPRGSSGYGEAFSRAIFADWGNKDFEDVDAGVDHAISLGFVDPDRIGVGGWSYGGILTNYCIIKSRRFRAAISGASETDYYSCFGFDDLHLDWVEELGFPWEKEDLYRRISPITNVDKIHTPTLVMCGEKDFRCPLPQSEKLYLSLKTLGRATALVIYPGQSHGIRKPSYEVDRLRRYGLWYDKYVRGLDADPTYEEFKPTTSATND